MDTYHAQAVVNGDRTIVLTLPFPAGEKVDVVVMPHEDALEKLDEMEWKQLGLRKFLEGYDDEDSVYDAL